MISIISGDVSGVLVQILSNDRKDIDMFSFDAQDIAYAVRSIQCE